MADLWHYMSQGLSRDKAEALQKADRQHRRAAKRQSKKFATGLAAASATVKEAAQALATAERARLAVMVAAHQAGLSYATIANQAGLSKSRVHQLLQAHSTARDIRETQVTDSPARGEPCTTAPQ